MSAHKPREQGQNRGKQCEYCGMRARRGGLWQHKWAKHRVEMTAAADATYAHFKLARASHNGGTEHG